jgi:hypothetical protein
MLHHEVDINLPEQLGQGSSTFRSIGVDLHANPFHVEVKLLFKLFDDALADVAERSDVIGEDSNTGGHGESFLVVL